MAEHANAELFRRGYKAFSEGDMDTMRTLFADDVVWHHPGNNQLTGDYKGTDAVIGLFAKEFELTGGTIKVEVHDVLANDDHAIALHTGTATRNGETFTGNEALVAHVRGGKVTEFWLLPTDMALFDRTWA